MKRSVRICLGVAFGAIGLGIIVLLIAFATGRGRIYRDEDRSYSYDYQPVEEITSINADIKFGKIKVTNGDEFSVSVSNMVQDGFSSEVKDGIWYLEDHYDDDEVFQFCGISIPISISFFGWSIEDYYPTILVTIPADFEADNLTISLGAGTMDITSVVAEEASFEVGAGQMNIRKMSSTVNADFNVGTGELDIMNLTAKDVTMDCGAGSIEASGEITGDSDIHCGVGEIDLDLIGEEEDYNYIVDCGLGSVKINRNEYDFNADKTIYNNCAIGTFRLDCGIGEINMNIK